MISSSASQKDVFCDKMVFWVLTQFLFHALQVFFIKS